MDLLAALQYVLVLTLCIRLLLYALTTCARYGVFSRVGTYQPK